MSVAPRPVLRAAALPALYAAAAFLLYAPALASFFHSDDFVLLDAVRTRGPFGVWSGGAASPHFLRPLISLSLYCDWRLWGLHPAGYHAANVVVHVLNALLVAAVCRRLSRLAPDRGGDHGRSDLLSAAAGLLFLVAPIHPEAVTWVSGRTDVYSAFFCLAAFVGYLEYRGGGRRAVLAASVLLFGLSMACKEAAALFPLIVFVLELVVAAPARAGGRLRRAAAAALPFLGVLGAYLFARRLLLGVLVGGYGAAEHARVSPASLVQAAYWFLCGAFLPLFPRFAYCAAALALAAALFAWRVRRGGAPPRALLLFLLAAFYLAAGPVLSLGGGPAPDGMSGRLAYLPSAFAAPALAVFLDFVSAGRRDRFAAAVGALAAVFSVQLHGLNVRWQAAGEMARRCVLAAADGAAAPELVLDAPDTLYPAFVLRNGLPEAVRLFRPGGAGRVDVATTVTLFSAADAVYVTTSGDTYVLRRPPGPGVVLSFFAAGGGGPSVRVAPDGASVTFPGGGTARRVLVYEAGTLRPWGVRKPY